MKEELNILIQAQYPLIYLVTSEEERAEQSIFKVSQDLKPQRRVYIWTVTHGIVEYGQPRNTTQHNTVSPEAAIDWIIRQKNPVYLFLKIYIPLLMRRQQPDRSGTRSLVLKERKRTLS